MLFRFGRRESLPKFSQRRSAFWYLRWVVDSAATVWAQQIVDPPATFEALVHAGREWVTLDQTCFAMLEMLKTTTRLLANSLPPQLVKYNWACLLNASTLKGQQAVWRFHQRMKGQESHKYLETTKAARFQETSRERAER